MRVASAAAPGGLLERIPERLVVEGFRHWLAGHATGDLRHWEAAWNLYATALGPRQARPVMDRLSRWVVTVRNCAGCPIRHLPGGCRELCRDECFALAMVAAGQHRDLPSVRFAAGFFLLEPDAQEQAVERTLAFAQALEERDLRLRPIAFELLAATGSRPPRDELH